MAIDMESFITLTSTSVYVQTNTNFFFNNEVSSYYLLLCINSLVETECSIFVFKLGKHEFMST